MGGVEWETNLKPALITSDRVWCVVGLVIVRMCVPVSMRLHVYGCAEVILRPAAPTHPPTHAGIGEHPSVMDDFGITGISKGPACNTNPHTQQPHPLTAHGGDGTIEKSKS